MIIAAIPTVKASTALWVTHYLAFGLLYRCGGSDRIFTIFPKLMSINFLFQFPLIVSSELQKIKLLLTQQLWREIMLDWFLLTLRMQIYKN